LAIRHTGSGNVLAACVCSTWRPQADDGSPARSCVWSIHARQTCLSGLRKWKEGIRASAKTSRLDCACVRTSDQRGCTELEAQPEIAQIAGDLYRFQNNFHVLVFVVMPEGVVATDPIDANAAAWLRGQIQERFKQPVRYVIYSHDHADHIAGGAVLKEAGATVIAQLNGRGSNGCPPSKGFLGHVGGHRSLLDISCS
jgi:hypothetical protein